MGFSLNVSTVRTAFKSLACLAVVAGLAVAAASCNESDAGGGSGSTDAQVQLVGAGASFPAPLYNQWFKDYHDKHANIVVEYQSIGSGGGVKQFTAGKTDFGASDAAMKDEEIAETKGGVVLLPMTAGAIVLTYNADGVADLKLTRDAYAGIFLGKVKKWSDPAIAAANAGVTLPNKDISVIHRSDASGTSFVFTQHLSAVSPDWQAGPGKGTSVNWPAGVGAKGNDGVTAAVKQTPGSIGYVEYNYAVNNKLPTAQLQNKAGKFVKATPESAATSLASVQMPEDLRAWVPDPDGDTSYPIVTYTWILAKPVYADANKGKALKDVLNYGLTDGQKISTTLGYIPLPEAVVQKVKAKLDTIKAGN